MADPRKQNHRNSELFRGFYERGIGQRWAEAEMVKCEVIFSRTLKSRLEKNRMIKIRTEPSRTDSASNIRKGSASNPLEVNQTRFPFFGQGAGDRWWGKMRYTYEVLSCQNMITTKRRRP